MTPKFGRCRELSDPAVYGVAVGHPPAASPVQSCCRTEVAGHVIVGGALRLQSELRRFPSNRTRPTIHQRTIIETALATFNDFIQVACLKQVRAAPKFICLLDGSFGTTWNERQISILELELAAAAFSKRDMWIFRLAPYNKEDPRIESLLKAVAIACPAARIREPLLHDQVLDSIAWLLVVSVRPGPPCCRGREA